MSVSSQKRAIRVSDAVSKTITGNFILYESLKLKIVNYHALAAKISSEVMELTGREQKIETIVVAIKRFADALPPARLEAMAVILKDSKLGLAGSVVDVKIRGNGTSMPQLLRDLTKFSHRLAGVPNIFQVANSVTIIVEDEKDVQLLDRALSKRYSLSITRNVAKLVIHFPPAVKRVLGIASFITELLYRNGISTHDAFLGEEEVVMILPERIASKAFQVLSEEISKSS